MNPDPKYIEAENQLAREMMIRVLRYTEQPVPEDEVVAVTITHPTPTERRLWEIAVHLMLRQK